MKRLKELGARRSSLELPKQRNEAQGRRSSLEVPKQSNEAQTPRVREISEAENSRAGSVDCVVTNEKLLGEYQQVLSVPGNLRSSVRAVVVSRRSSFSSSSDIPSSSSSRLSDASSVNNYSAVSSKTVAARRNYNARTVVVAFDANARDALVTAVAWTFQTSLRAGDVLILLGVMDFIRGPLGYKCQVNDQTWLGANKKLLQDEIALKKLAWLSMPGLKTLCEEREVRLVVEVQPAQRLEVAIVREAEASGAAQVILDKSLNNRHRKYYLQLLSCEVTRMRRSGGVEVLRAAPKLEVPASPTSVIPPGPPPAVASLLLRDDEEELFTIDHCRRPSMDQGYESDDLFSINGDAGWRTSSFAAHRAHNSSVASHDPDRDSSSRLDNRLLSLTRLQLGD